MGPSAQGGGAQRWGHFVDLGASLCTCDESELDSDLKFRVSKKRSMRRTQSATSCDPGMKAMMMEEQWCNMVWREEEQQKDIYAWLETSRRNRCSVGLELAAAVICIPR